MSADVFVFAARETAPAETMVRAYVASLERVDVEVDMPLTRVFPNPSRWRTSSR